MSRPAYSPARLGESAVRTTDPDNPKLVSEVAISLLHRLTEPTPDAQARLYAPDGTVLANSRVREGPGGTVTTEPLPPPLNYGLVQTTIGWLYDRVLAVLPHHAAQTMVDLTPSAGGPDWQPDVKEELRLNSAGNSKETAPYIRRTRDNRLLVTVAVPVERDKHTVGIISLTREAREVDESLFSVRMSILALFGLALALTVLLSWYLSLTIARPILRLAEAAADMREGGGRSGSVPRSLLRRRDEVGALASALSNSASALWERMDATERFAADVAHEIKNPLSSIRSAIETLLRIEDPGRQRQLLTIIAQDVQRLDRLISDVSDASRLDAELSRGVGRSDRRGADPAHLAGTRRGDTGPGRRPETGGHRTAGRPVRLGGGRPVGASAAKSHRQRAIFQPAARQDHCAGPPGRGGSGALRRG